MTIRYQTIGYVDIPDDQALSVLKQLIYKEAKGAFFRKVNGKEVLYQNDPEHRHGSISEVRVNSPTKLQIAAVRFREAMGWRCI